MNIPTGEAEIRPIAVIRDGLLDRLKIQSGIKSDEAFARLIGVSRPTLARYKAGEEVSMRAAVGIALAFGLGLGEVVEMRAEEVDMAFLPVASQLADILGDDVIPVIAQLAEEEGPALAEAFAEILPDLTQLAKDLLPLLPDLVKAFADGLPVVIEMISGTAEVLGPLITDLGGFLGGMQLISDFINGDMSLQDMLERVEGLGGGFGQLLRDLIALVVSVPVHLTVLKVNVIAKINEILGFIGSIPGRIQVALTLAGVSLRSSGIALMQTFLDGIKSMVEPIVNTVSNLLSQVQEYFPHSPAKRGPLSGAGWTRLRKSGEAFWDQWIGGMGGEEPPFFPFPGGPGGPSYPGGAAAVAASERSVYVQNPWGPEYMRAQTAEVARGESAAVVSTATTAFRRGGRRR